MASKLSVSTRQSRMATYAPSSALRKARSVRIAVRALSHSSESSDGKVISLPLRPKLDIANFELEKEILKFSQEAAKWSNSKHGDALTCNRRSAEAAAKHDKFAWEDIL